MIEKRKEGLRENHYDEAFEKRRRASSSSHDQGAVQAVQVDGEKEGAVRAVSELTGKGR